MGVFPSNYVSSDPKYAQVPTPLEIPSGNWSWKRSLV